MKSTGLSGRVGNASLKIATQKNLGMDDKNQTKPTTAKDMAADTGIERAHNSTIRATAIQPVSGTPMSRAMSKRSVEAPFELSKCRFNKGPSTQWNSYCS